MKSVAEDGKTGTHHTTRLWKNSGSNSFTAMHTFLLFCFPPRLRAWILTPFFFFLSPSSISLCVYTTLYPFTIMDAQMVSGLGSLQIRRLWTPITNLGVEMMLPSCLNALFTSAVCWGERNFFPQGCDHPLRFWSHFPREGRSILGSFFWSVPKR